jgi:DNA replication protein DnaC
MTNEEMRKRAAALGFHGLVARWDELADPAWILPLLEGEEAERRRRSLERRIKNAHIGAFKPMADFDWTWPAKIPRDLVEDLLSLQFIRDATNAVFRGPNGVGKSMITKNIAHAALLQGHTVCYTTASAMLAELASQDGSIALQRRLRRYQRYELLVIDEVGYLSYDNRHADLLFEVVNRRYRNRSIVISTNRPFAEWNEVFPSAACVVALIDRLIHDAEIVVIAGESYRAKEAAENAARRAAVRKKPRK